MIIPHYGEFIINIGILIFNDIELMDFAGPFEVFSVTNELNEYSYCNTFTVAKTPDMIKSVNGLKTIPDYSFEDSPEINILIIPGGIGTKSLLDDSTVLKWVINTSAASDITFSVCSGARVLAKCGLLENSEFITHHEVINDVLFLSPSSIPVYGRRYIDNGKIMTSAGISAGIDLSLYTVEKLFGKGCRIQTQRYMEYGDWDNNDFTSTSKS